MNTQKIQSPLKNVSFPNLKQNYQQPFLSNSQTATKYFFFPYNKSNGLSNTQGKNEYKDHSFKQTSTKNNHIHQQSLNISYKQQEGSNNLQIPSNNTLEDPLPALKKRIQTNNSSIKKQYTQILQSSLNTAPTKNSSKVNHSHNPSLIKQDNNIQIPNIGQSKCSQKQVGPIVAYSANTHQGLIRNYNEDRVSIILNMVRPSEKQSCKQWPHCSFFAVYDGHGGHFTAEFLRDNLHQYIVKDDDFPRNPKLAIYNAFEKLEKQLLKMEQDKSGSCALTALIVKDLVYIANVGDSRAIACKAGRVVQITTDHKPDNIIEEMRIRQNGGDIYQSKVPVMNGKQLQYISGPHRVNPGRLAVSRAFGDMEAKLAKFGGLQNVVSAEPDVFTLKVDEFDFLLLGCDGIFDQLSNEQVNDAVWKTEGYSSVHEFCGKAVENVLKLSLKEKSFDNVTVVMLAFPNLEKQLQIKRLNPTN